ncbi:MAG: glycerophosphodiester phosphodiesterase [Actinomycetota bacterium]|nr:glycerophosphodiester phosphodiesterase [Actinomycetota bacterium]
MTSATAGPIAFAHRGARAERPDNTIEAFARALELGSNGLESDAWLTADATVVLDHDGVTGPLWRRRAISACRRRELPGHIPSLLELYQACGTDFELSLDVKDPAALPAIVATATGCGAADRLWLCHNDWRPMAAWRKVAPDSHLVESTNLAWMSEGLAARVSALAAAGFDAVNLHRSQWSDDAVREVHAVGLRAFGWDAQTVEDLAALIAVGVDGVYSDHVERMVEVLGRAGSTDR